MSNLYLCSVNESPSSHSTNISAIIFLGHQDVEKIFCSSNFYRNQNWFCKVWRRSLLGTMLPGLKKNLLVFIAMAQSCCNSIDIIAGNGKILGLKCCVSMVSCGLRIQVRVKYKWQQQQTNAHLKIWVNLWKIICGGPCGHIPMGLHHWSCNWPRIWKTPRKLSIVLVLKNDLIIIWNAMTHWKSCDKSWCCIKQ